MSDVTLTGASNYDWTVYGTWDLSLKEIKKRAGGQSSGENAQAGCNSDFSNMCFLSS